MKITADNERASIVFGLVWVTAIPAIFLWNITAVMFRSHLSGDWWLVLMVPAAIVALQLLVWRRVIWRAFGVDEIVVEHGALNWSAKALWFKQKAEIPVGKISQISPIMSLFSQDNRVEMTVANRTYFIGDGLLQDETTALANALKRAVGLQ